MLYPTAATSIARKMRAPDIDYPLFSSGMINGATRYKASKITARIKIHSKSPNSDLIFEIKQFPEATESFGLFSVPIPVVSVKTDFAVATKLSHQLHIPFPEIKQQAPTEVPLPKQSSGPPSSKVQQQHGIKIPR
jgi:hypothetical protein